MTFCCRKVNNGWHGFAMLLFPISLLFLAGCGGSTHTSTPPVQPDAQQLLADVAQNLNTANTLHGVFSLSITSRTFYESFGDEIWTEVPSKIRAVLLQSPLASFSSGTVVVDDGKQAWLYDSTKKIVYTGSVSSVSSSAQAVAPVSGSAGDVLLAPLRVVQQIFAQGNAKLDSPSATVNGRAVYELYIEAKPNSPAGDFTGEVFIDKTTELPVQVVFDTQDTEEVVNIRELSLNLYIPDSIFTFTPPAGAKVLPLSSSSNSPLTLAQVQQGAGYHLLAIPSSSTKYVLQHVEVLGSTGHEIYELDYASGGTAFAIKESKVLANNSFYSGTRISVRGTIGTILTARGGVSTLFWIEKGVGIGIAGPLSQGQVMSIAQLLS